MHSENRLTILVNSCDAYEDLWIPFFTLLKKYGRIPNVPILLNTETKTFSMEGLEITCVHAKVGSKYGERMRNALTQVKTEYVLMLLDDFFLRKPLDVTCIMRIMDWMDTDPHIVCFNSEPINCYVSVESGKYPEYVRIPPANRYACNMQAAIWRTKSLMNYWRPNVSPWEWEEYCSLLTAKYSDDKLYCRTDSGENWIDYGHYTAGDLWAVVRGKWILADVKPLFERENITVDFSQRGCYLQNEMDAVASDDARKGMYLDRVVRCLGGYGFIRYFIYRLRRLLFRNGPERQLEFFEYMQENMQKNFMLEAGEIGWKKSV